MNIILFSEEDKFSPSDVEIANELWVFYKNDDRYSHIKKILKLKEEDKFKAGIINGGIGEAEILSFTKERILFSFVETTKALSLPPVKLILGFPRPIQLKRILRDVGSLACSEIFLCGTELGEASYLKSSLAEESQIRKYLLDGISQAGQSLLPKFSFHSSIEKCLNFIEAEKCSSSSKKILLDIDKTAKPLSKLDFENYDEFILAIGSERGWTDNERKAFSNHNFVKSSIGDRILRTETATTSALAITLSKLI